MKLKIALWLSLFSMQAHAANINPLRLPVWSDLEKYQSPTIQTIPTIHHDYQAFAGLNYAAKNGFGLEGGAFRKLSRYLSAGARMFVGILYSDGIVRPSTVSEQTAFPTANVPTTSEYETILANPETWFSFIPEIGFMVNTQILPLNNDLWSESSWFGFGKAFIGGRSGWTISFEPAVNKRWSADSQFSWTVRAKYSFGWLYASDDLPGTIPFDWFNLTAGVTYLW